MLSMQSLAELAFLHVGLIVHGGDARLNEIDGL